MHEHMLVWREDLPPAGNLEPALRPAGFARGRLHPPRQVRVTEVLAEPARTLLLETLAALRTQAAADAREPIRIPLCGLDARQREIVGDLLGAGEVCAEVGGDAHYRIQESVLPGLWRVRMRLADGELAEWLEVGAVPAPVRQAGASLPRQSVAIPGGPRPGAMNAPALITELNERSLAWRPGRPNHVINFSLLPLTDADAELLTATVGQIPLVIRSEGYGSCRVFATGLQHVWAVQYLNSMGQVIVDTLEVGDVPAAVSAAREDFEDSAARLTDMLQAYAR